MIYKGEVLYKTSHRWKIIVTWILTFAPDEIIKPFYSSFQEDPNKLDRLYLPSFFWEKAISLIIEWGTVSCSTLVGYDLLNLTWKHIKDLSDKIAIVKHSSLFCSTVSSEAKKAYKIAPGRSFSSLTNWDRFNKYFTTIIYSPSTLRS